MRQKDSSQKHWGSWISQRARYAGFHRQSDLAEFIGCTREQICRWFQLAQPPAAMRKGFDRSLAHALRTDRRTLFADFPRIAPEDAPLIDAEPEPIDALKRKVNAVVELLDADRLRELHERGRELLKKEMATSAA